MLFESTNCVVFHNRISRPLVFRFYLERPDFSVTIDPTQERPPGSLLDRVREKIEEKRNRPSGKEVGVSVVTVRSRENTTEEKPPRRR